MLNMPKRRVVEQCCFTSYGISWNHSSQLDWLEGMHCGGKSAGRCPNIWKPFERTSQPILAQCNWSHTSLVNCVERNHLRQVVDDMAPFQTNTAGPPGKGSAAVGGRHILWTFHKASCMKVLVMRYGSVNQMEVLTTWQWQCMNWLLLCHLTLSNFISPHPGLLWYAFFARSH